MKKIIVVCAVLAAAIVLLAACGARNGGIEGTWEGQISMGDLSVTMELTFNPDGTYTTRTAGVEVGSGDYRVEGGKLFFNGTENTFSIRGNTLTLHMPLGETGLSGEMTFTRK